MTDEHTHPNEDHTLLARAAEFLDSKGWKYHCSDEAPVIHFGLMGENARWLCTLIADDAAPSLALLSSLPCVVPPDRRPQVTELFARINWRLTHGCFELDVVDGETRFRTSQPLPAPEVSLDLIGELVCSNLWAVDRFFGTIMQVVYTRMTPRRALAALESSCKTKSEAPKPNPVAEQRRFEMN